MPRVFHALRRRRRLLLQTTSLRLHGTLANHPDQCPRLPAYLDLRPANVTPAGHAANHEAPQREDAAAYTATVGPHLRRGDLPRAEAMFRAAPAYARDAHLDTVMLDGYAKASRLDHARRLFDAMPTRTVVSWTAMVHGYARAGMLREAREMFDVMPQRSMVTWTVMVKAYADRSHFQEAMELLDRMPWRNSYSSNVMISGFLRAGRVDEAVHLFERMHHRTVVSWTAMVTGLAQNGRVSMAREYFDRMPENKDIMAWNAMLTAYANDGQMDEARTLFDSMPAKDQVSWNIVIDGYRKDEALGLFLLMLRSGVCPDSTTLTCVLLKSEITVEVGQIHGLATRLGLLSGTILGNTLLTMYSRRGDLHSAWQAFKMLQEKDAITWTSMMQAFVNHGRASCALQAFGQILRHGHHPKSTTFTAALSACRHAGLVEKGRNIFRSISSCGLRPTIEHCDILHSMARASEFREIVAAVPPELRDQEMELNKRKNTSSNKSVEDSQSTIEEPAGVEAAPATECTPTKSVFGWAVAYLKALVGK